MSSRRTTEQNTLSKIEKKNEHAQYCYEIHVREMLIKELQNAIFERKEN